MDGGRAAISRIEGDGDGGVCDDEGDGRAVVLGVCDELVDAKKG